MIGWQSVALLMLWLAAPGVAWAEQARASIAVFPFELEDKSAGAGIIPPDDYDRRYLKESAEMAKDLLSQSGRYTVLDLPAEPDAAVAPHGLRNCGGCEGAIAAGHGAALALLGVVTRVNRTEHTMFIRILDANTKQPVAFGFTDLRMGANYAWPRSVKWLMRNRILPKGG